MSKTSKKKISKKSPSKKKLPQDWPKSAGAREILWRPDRFSYLSDKKKPECVFCDALKKGLSVESLVVGMTDLSMIIMNKYPYNNGHLLVLPKRHVADVLDVTEEEYLDINRLLRKTVAALRKCYSSPPAGFNLGLNLGSVAGAGIPSHLHYHVIPRWLGDSNFFPLVAQTKVISETLEQTYKRLLPYLE